MVLAAARSVREEKSRQRYALQEFALVRVSLIKGKSGWRERTGGSGLHSLFIRMSITESPCIGNSPVTK